MNNKKLKKVVSNEVDNEANNEINKEISHERVNQVNQEKEKNELLLLFLYFNAYSLGFRDLKAAMHAFTISRNNPKEVRRRC